MPSLYVCDHKRVIRHDAPHPGHQRVKCVIPRNVRHEGHKHVKRMIPRNTRRECHVTHPTKVFNYFLFIYAILIHKCFERPTVLKDRLLLTNFTTAESQRLSVPATVAVSAVQPGYRSQTLPVLDLVLPPNTLLQGDN
jgi:hypothetical protein